MGFGTWGGESSNRETVGDEGEEATVWGARPTNGTGVNAGTWEGPEWRLQDASWSARNLSKVTRLTKPGFSRPCDENSNESPTVQIRAKKADGWIFPHNERQRLNIQAGPQSKDASPQRRTSERQPSWQPNSATSHPQPRSPGPQIFPLLPSTCPRGPGCPSPRRRERSLRSGRHSALLSKILSALGFSVSSESVPSL